MTQTNETKRIPAVSAETNLYGLTLTFANGKRLMLECSQLTSEIQSTAKVHGLKQKLVDAAAISRDPKTGKSATVDDKYQAVKAVYDRLLEGRWNEEREGGGATSYLLQALIQLKPTKTADELREWLGTKSDAEKKALELNPAVASIISTLKAAKAKDVDSEALLGQLGD